MSPELERLLEALYEKLTCPPEEKEHRVATFERLLQDALSRRLGTSREMLLDALQDRYREFCRARRKPTTCHRVRKAIFLLARKTFAPVLSLAPCKLVEYPLVGLVRSGST